MTNPLSQLPLAEQFTIQTWRNTIDQAGPYQLEELRKISGLILDYAITNRAFALAVAQSILPQQKTPAEAGAHCDQQPDQSSR